MRSGEKTAIVVGLAAMAFILLQEPPENPPPSLPQPIPPRPKPEPSPVPPAPPSSRGPNDTDDETALARMLVSETDNRKAWPVIGWMLLQTAKSRNESLYQRLTSGIGYGPRFKDSINRYADTRKAPTEESRNAARRLIAGELLPSAAIRAFGHSSWVEILTETEKEADDLLRKQGKPKSWGGIWARIRGTRWYLLNPKAPVVAWRAGAAREALAAVPVLSATDERVA